MIWQITQYILTSVYPLSNSNWIAVHEALERCAQGISRYSLFLSCLMRKNYREIAKIVHLSLKLFLQIFSYNAYVLTQNQRSRYVRKWDTSSWKIIEIHQTIQNLVIPKWTKILDYCGLGQGFLNFFHLQVICQIFMWAWVY